MKWALWGVVVVFLLLAVFCFNFYRVHLEDKAHADESARFHLNNMKLAGPDERPRQSRAMENAIAASEHYQQLSSTFLYLAIAALVLTVLCLALALLRGRRATSPGTSS